jgi:succinate dehydrogenase / fumarate reductase cytochrome b subunit
MSWFVSYVRSSVGAKQIMAVSGLGLLLFAILHMVGHLGMFAGRDAYNTYAHTLQSLGALKWAVRGGLLGIFAIHVATAISLARANGAARPQKYAVFRTRTTTFFARTMTMTGLVILAFVIYHLAHFTLGWVQPASFHQLDAKGRYDAYTMFVMGFRNLPILLSYLVAVTLLSFHLTHGASSWLQSLGLRHPRYDGAIDKLGPLLGLTLAVGYAAPPLAVVARIIQL